MADLTEPDRTEEGKKAEKTPSGPRAPEGIEPERYKEINKQVFDEIIKEVEKPKEEKDFDDLMDRIAEIPEDRKERDAAMFLLGFYYYFSYSFKGGK